MPLCSGPLRHLLRACVIAAALGSVGARGAAAQEARAPLAPPDPQALWHLRAPQSPRLGIAFPHSPAQSYAVLPTLGVGVVRIGARWSAIEPTPGTYDFATLDSRIVPLARLGITTFLTLEPDHPRLTRHSHRVRNGTPRDLRQWADLVTAVVERYDGDGIDDAPRLKRPLGYIQTGNEFLSPYNKSGGWRGSTGELIGLFEATYQATRRADPKVTVVLGGITATHADVAVLNTTSESFVIHELWGPDEAFVLRPHEARRGKWRAMLDNSLLPVLHQAPHDIADVHLYGPEERDATRLSVMAHLSERPVLSSECGGPTIDYGTGWSGQRHYAAVLERNLATWAAGAPFCLWFGLSEAIGSTYHNRQTPLFTAEGIAKPGALAYPLLAGLIEGDPAVTALGPHSYRIARPEGAVCLSFDGTTPACGGSDGLCVVDAARRKVHRMTREELTLGCAAGAVALTGAGLATLLERNRLE